MSLRLPLCVCIHQPPLCHQCPHRAPHPLSPGRKATAAHATARQMPGRTGMRFCIPLQPGQMGLLESRLADISPDMPAPAPFIALPRSSLEATSHLLAKPSVASTRVVKPEDLYFRRVPQRHRGEQPQLREWLAKAGRRKKYPEGKSRVWRGADERLQTTSMLPRDPQPPSKELCSLLTSLGHKRRSPAAPPQPRSPLTAQGGGGNPKASRNLQHGCRQQVVLDTHGGSSFPALFWHSLA